jgi:hypothetical protein
MRRWLWPLMTMSSAGITAPSRERRAAWIAARTSQTGARSALQRPGDSALANALIKRLYRPLLATSRHFVATQQFSRFRSEADIQRAAAYRAGFMSTLPIPCRPTPPRCSPQESLSVRSLCGGRSAISDGNLKQRHCRQILHSRAARPCPPTVASVPIKPVSRALFPVRGGQRRGTIARKVSGPLVRRRPDRPHPLLSLRSPSFSRTQMPAGRRCYCRDLAESPIQVVAG